MPWRSPRCRGSSIQNTPRSMSRRATCQAWSTCQGGAVSHGMRHPWLQSTISSIWSPTAERTASSTARSSWIDGRPNRSFIAVNPSSIDRRATSTVAGAERCTAVDAYRRSVGSVPPSIAHTGSSRILPARSHSARSRGHGRPAWKSTFASRAACCDSANGSSPRKCRAWSANPYITSPDPMPTRPSESRTLTIVAGNRVRGRGSHDAGKGGSSGSW